MSGPPTGGFHVREWTFSEFRLYLQSQGVNFINILGPAFTCADTKSAKNTVNPSVFFTLLGYMRIKVARKMLVKSTQGFEILRSLDGVQNPTTQMHVVRVAT